MSSAAAPLEDARGIDVSLLRAKLRLTPAQRVAELVAAVRTIQAVRTPGVMHLEALKDQLEQARREHP